MKRQLESVVKATLVAKGCVIVNLKGRCMEPFLVSGDKTLIRSSPRVRIGDICLISLNNESLAIHRVVHVNDCSVFTKGDFSGKGELTPIGSILGIADAFQLKDTDSWSSYDSPQETKERIVALSLQLCPQPETDKHDREEIRAALSEILRAERQRLLSEGNYHVKTNL